MTFYEIDVEILDKLYEIEKKNTLNNKQETILLELHEDYLEKLKETPDDKVLQENIKLIESYLTNNEDLKN